MGFIPRSIGFIGLGNMGYPMVQNLAKKLPKDTAIFIYDVNQAVVEKLYAEFPTQLTRSKNVTEVFSQSEVVLTMLPEGRHVRSVYMGPDTGLSKIDLRGKIMIDCSTIDVDSSLTVKDYITQIEPTAAFYDAPVSGGVEGAASGNLAFYVGIHPNDKNVDAVLALTGLMGAAEKIIPCGKPSAGLVAKIAHNYLGGVMNVVCCETMNLGISAGLDPHVLHRVLVAGASRNPLIEHLNPVPGCVKTAPSSRGYEPGFKASLMAKDLTLAVQMAKLYDSTLVLGSAASELYQKALPEFGDRDFTVLYRLLAKNQ